MGYKYVYLILAALSYASMGALVRVLSTDLPPFTQLFLRLLFSGFLTFFFVIFSKSGFKLKQKKDYLLILPMGIIGYGLELSFYTLSFYFTTISNALFIFSSYPIITALFAFIFLKEKLTKRLFIAFLILLSSLLLIFNPTTINHVLLGNVYALLNAICFSVYVIFSRVLSKHGNKPPTITFWTVTLGALTSGIGSAFIEHPHIYLAYTTIGILLVFGFLNFLAWNLVNQGFATTKAAVGTMILSLEAVFGSVIGLIFFHEIPTVIFAIGAVEILIAIYLASFKLD